MMQRTPKSLWLLLASGLWACGGASTTPQTPTDTDPGMAVDAESDVPTEDVGSEELVVTPITVRVATFNTSLYGDAAGDTLRRLQGDDAHARCIAEVLDEVRPDIVLINEFDYDVTGDAPGLLAALISEVSPESPLQFEYTYAATSNTGIPSGFDLDHSGEVISTPGSIPYGGDSLGFGRFEGQYAFAVLSRYEIAEVDIRTFQHFLWRDMPGAMLPDDPDTAEAADWYSADALAVLPLSSKNHVDVPIQVGGTTIHLLASHPTPPAFDGPEDRNGMRNHDEVRFWVDYVGIGDGSYLVDDAGQSGGLEGDAHFVIVGDLNADPIDGSGPHGAITTLLDHELTHDVRPESEGAVEASERDGQANLAHQANAAHDTADFSDRSVGNIRVDYALPSANLETSDQGVFWPTTDDALSACAAVTDHHLVWVDLELR